MPIYEYACAKCGHMMEVLQKISDPAPAKCENCGSKRVSRVMSRTSFQLKGDGWYITDYARKGKSDGGASEKPEKAEKAEKSEKPEKKSESKDSKKKDGKKAS